MATNTANESYFFYPHLVEHIKRERSRKRRRFILGFSAAVGLAGIVIAGISKLDTAPKRMLDGHYELSGKEYSFKTITADTLSDALNAFYGIDVDGNVSEILAPYMNKGISGHGPWKVEVRHNLASSTNFI